LEKFIQFITNWFGELTALQKQRLVIGCTVIFALILTLAVVIPILNQNNSTFDEPGRLIINSPIPPGELFLPDEPDFVPGIILGRDRRTSWTEEDAAEHWSDPLKNGEEQWRKKIETAIDVLLENIP